MLRAAARRPVRALTAPIARRRMLGAGYTGPREAGYDEVELSKLRALPDQPFFMLNLLNVSNMEEFSKYNVETAGIFKELAHGEAVYVGRLRGAPVPVKGEGVDTSGYNVMMLIKYPSVSGFFKFIDSPEYHAAYPHRFRSLEDGKSALIASFPITGSATEGLATKVPGED
jgi:uncharacterized protein (DUF1330 family)